MRLRKKHIWMSGLFFILIGIVLTLLFKRICAVFVLLGFVTIVYHKKIKYNQDLILKILTLFLTIVFFIIILESISFMILRIKEPNPVVVSDNCKYESNNAFVSWPVANTSCNHVKHFKNGSIIFNVTYELDEYRRRVNIKKSGKKHLVFFGGSFVFGEPHPAKESFPYFLIEKLKNYQPYTYAYRGYGPQNMLYQLENWNLQEQIPQRSGNAIYFFIDDHFCRSVGSINCDWAYDYPYYFLENGKLHSYGTFVSEKPFKIFLFKFLNKIKYNSFFLNLINFDFPEQIGDEEIELTFQMIKRSKELYESQFDGKFIVIFFPESPGYSKKIVILKNMLKENNIDYVYLKINVGDISLVSHDGHPTAEFMKEFAEGLYPELGKIIKNG